MNKLKLIIFSISLLLIAGVTSCQKVNEGTDEKGEGTLALSYNIGAETRAVLSDEELEEHLKNYILKIYSYNEQGETDEEKWQLIRYYTPAYDVPSEIYLKSGKYKATVSMQVDVLPVFATREETEFTYAGEQEFVITSKEITKIEIPCKVINSIVKIVYNFDGISGSQLVDGSVVVNGQTIIKDLVSYVSASDSFSKDKIDEIPTLKYTDNGEIGYFMLPEGMTNFSWGTYFNFSDKTDVDFTEVASTGIVSNPQPSTVYTLNMNYSKTPNGGLDLDINVSSETIDEHEDDFIFSPQPTIAGRGASSAFSYIEGVEAYAINSLEPLSKIDISINNTTLSPLVNGEIVEDVAGIESMTISEDKLSAEVVLNSDFFEMFANGGENKFSITAYDNKNSFGNKALSVNTTGVIPIIENADYWNNIATLKACVTNTSATDVKIYARTAGTEEWYLATTGVISNLEHSATMNPVWASNANPYGNTVKTLTLGATVGGSYECKLEVDGVQKGKIVTIKAGGTPQVIPYGDMNSDLSCFGTNNSGSSNWASGNNTFVEGLCSQATIGGSKAAKLLSKVAVGNFAAGNLFFGQFKFNGIIEQTGTVKFGHSFAWTARPRALKFKYSADLKNVDMDIPSAVGNNLVKGQPDKARVYMCVVDWSGRHEVTSGKGSPSGVWDPEKSTSLDKGAILGYASLFITKSTDGNMHEIEVPMQWYDTNTKPSKDITLVISAATSAYGDYMVGGEGTTLHIDDFELVY